MGQEVTTEGIMVMCGIMFVSLGSWGVAVMCGLGVAFVVVRIAQWKR